MLVVVDVLVVADVLVGTFVVVAGAVVVGAVRVVVGVVVVVVGAGGIGPAYVTSIAETIGRSAMATKPRSRAPSLTGTSNSRS